MCPAQSSPLRFNVGDKVEVCSKDRGFIGSYYEATVVALLSDDRYMVQYETLLLDEATKEPLQELAFPKDLRPRPPRLRSFSGLKMHQIVDAFDNDGWWRGRINGARTESHGGRKIQYYDVHFTSTNEVVSYCSAAGQIRVHHHYTNAGRIEEAGTEEKESKWICLFLFL